MRSILFAGSFVVLSLFCAALGSPIRAASQQSTAVVVPKDPKALGYLNLTKRHPDADEGTAEFNRAYSTDLGLQRLTQMNGFLGSFRKLTNLVRRRISRADLATVGNTEGDMQTIGFHNIPLFVEGTILKQEYHLRQTEFELAQMKKAAGMISASELEQKRARYAEATKRFQVFWDTKLPTD